MLNYIWKQCINKNRLKNSELTLYFFHSFMLTVFHVSATRGWFSHHLPVVHLSLQLCGTAQIFSPVSTGQWEPHHTWASQAILGAGSSFGFKISAGIVDSYLQFYEAFFPKSLFRILCSIQSIKNMYKIHTVKSYNCYHINKEQKC